MPRAQRQRDAIGGEEVFGPVTQRLIQAYTALVDCDFVDQYRRYLR